MFRVGDKVGDYEIVARLKSGGMATLFLGRRMGASGFSKHVAIKVVHPHLAEDPSFVQMFVDEAMLSARIQHPNVVHVEELREVDGNHFLVMEYVSGCSLAQLLRELAKRERRLSPQLAVHIAVRVADGLHAAHELRSPDGSSLGVVHRDVSPENVLLAWEGHVKLIDFGVAKARFRSVQTTGAFLKGKIRYMAPEQATGQHIDRRSDIYALGVVLWEMLTMQRLFDADNDLALLEAVRNPRVVAPSYVVPDLPRELDRAVMQALQPMPSQRHQSAQQLRRELADAMPRAVALDASHLSELLMAVMEKQLTKARETLPASATGFDPNMVLGGPATPERDEVLDNLTVNAAGLASFVDISSGESGRSGRISRSATPGSVPFFLDAQGTPPPSGLVGAPSPFEDFGPLPSGPPFGGPTPATGGTPVVSATPGRGRLWLGLLATAIIAVGLAAGITLLVVLSSQPDVRVTSLAAAAPGQADAAAVPPSDAAEPADAGAALVEDAGGQARDAGRPDAGRRAITQPRIRVPRPPDTMRPTPMQTTMMGGVPLADDFGF